jgi:hypothetical protein
VDNTLTTFGHQSNKPTLWRGFVNSNFPLLPEDTLVKYGAVFGGLVRRQFNEDLVAAVSSLFHAQLIESRPSTEADNNIISGISCTRELFLSLST